MLQVQWNNVTEEQFGQIREELQSRSGLSMPGPEGTFEMKGFRLGYAFRAAEGTLRIQLQEFLAGPAAKLNLSPPQWV